MRPRARLLFASWLLAAAAGCGAAEAPLPVPASLELWNRSQFELLDVRVHASPSYLEAQSLLPAPLAIDARGLLYPGDRVYLTVFREQYARGPTRAFTTAGSLGLEPGRGYRLSVFDESFRLERTSWVDPDRAELPVLLRPTQGGPAPDADMRTDSDAGSDEDGGDVDAGDALDGGL
jgi:hypothetical protein